MKKKIFLVFSLLIISANICIAHSGRTDSNGGHWDYSTGEYHYHHGYSAHQHINGLCPYEAELSQILPSVCPNCGVSINSENGIYCFDCAYRLLPENIDIISLSDGPSDKTRSEYFNEVQQLNKQIENLESSIQYKQNSISDLNNKIDENNNEIDKLKSDKIFLHIIYLIIIAILFIYLKSKENKEDK